uniref:Ionotropic glutamate receptor L-glutamate and glycine-binding domain-containing protein n=1 Tax=Timema genevievae TaxID=629358 RepID=A0A7R9PQ08_TIMGE|nr:unnamed protein product [Timema genevievae]
MGKELTVVSFTYLPYTIVDNSTNPIAYEGTEFRLINELARNINFTCRPVIDDVDMWGEIWENGSGNGIMGSISEDKFDMGVAALYLWYHEYQYIDFTFPYYDSAITCLVPKPKQLPAWMLLILPFSLNMWVAIAASLGVATVSLYLVGRASFSYMDLSLEERNRNPYSNLWKSLFLTVGYVLQQSPADVKDPQAPQNTPLRHLVTWLLVVFLLVASVYSGGLASVLTVPKRAEKTHKLITATRRTAIRDLSLEERNRNTYSNLWKSLFLTVGYVLQQSPTDVKDPQAPQNTPLRHLVTWLFVVFLLVASVYSGGLASVLTVPKKHYQVPRYAPQEPVLYAQTLNVVLPDTVPVFLVHLTNRMDFAATVDFVYRVP